MQIDEFGQGRLAQHVGLDALVDDSHPANVVDDRGVCHVRFQLGIAVEMCAQGLVELTDGAFSLIDINQRRQCFGDQVGILVDDPVIKAQRRLAVIGFAGNTRTCQRATLRPGPAALRFFDEGARRRVVLFTDRLFGELAVIMCDLQRQAIHR